MIRLLIFLLFGITSHAATYYVDYVGGNNANNGTSTSTPWKHVRGDPAATGIPASGALVAGDTVIFKGGVRYVVTGAHNTGIQLSWNGAAGNPITYDGNSAGTFGTGKAIITDNHSPTGHEAFQSAVGRSNLTFKNFHFFEIGGSATLPADPGVPIAENSGTGIAIDGFFQNIIVENCNFEELGYYFNQKPMGPALNGFGIWAVNWQNVVVRNCNFSRVVVGIELGTNDETNGVTIDNCTFHDSIVWCIDIAARTSGTFTDNIEIKNCTFYDYYQFDAAFWTGYGEEPHTDGIFFRTGGGYVDNHYGPNNNFHNNLFYSTAAGGGTASIYITEGPSANVYNNLFIHQGKSRAISLANGVYGSGSDPQVLRFLNNTFIGNFNMQMDWGAPTGRLVGGHGADGDSTLIVKNNIFQDFATSSSSHMIYSEQVGAVPLMAWDYNCYTTDNPSNTYWYATGIGVGSLPGGDPLSELHAQGWELHGKDAVPQFVLANSSNGNPALNNLRLQSTSPARNAGENLSSLGLPGLNTDFEGKARPASGPWDMGAYQFGVVAPDTTRPTLVSKTINATGTQITLVFNETVAVGLGGNGGWTLSMTGGAATLAYNAGASGGANLVYNISRVIGMGQTGTISYVQPGNGIEDTSGNDLLTLSNSPVTNTASGDTAPPTPNPSTFGIAPSALTSSTITMTATNSTDATLPVQYFFNETSGNAGGSDSGWQALPTFTDAGLAAGTQYSYRVQVRDSAVPPNVTTFSATFNATTRSVAGAHPATPFNVARSNIVTP